jgi:hypothetical protein
VSDYTEPLSALAKVTLTCRCGEKRDVYMTFAEHEVLSRVLNDQELHLTSFDSSERSWWVRDDRLRAALRDEEAEK